MASVAIVELSGTANLDLTEEHLLLLLRGGWALEEPDVLDPVQRETMALGAMVGNEIDEAVNEEPASERGLP
jgi:hypothetical protein